MAPHRRKVAPLHFELFLLGYGGKAVMADRLIQLVFDQPRYLALVALLTGLLLGPRSSIALCFVAAALLAGVVYRPLLVILVITLLFAGGWIAQLRLIQIDHGHAVTMLGSSIDANATLLEPVRQRGDRLAVTRVRFIAGPVCGETAVVRIRQQRFREEPVAAPKSGWPDVGAGVHVKGKVTPLGDYDQQQRRRGTQVAIEVASLPTNGPPRGGVLGKIDRIRGKTLKSFDTGLAAPEAALLRGMVLGQDERLGQPTREAFRRAGLTHILAVSGHHVTLLAVFVLALGGVCGLQLRGRLLLVLAFIALYIPLTGSAPSIQRAGIMGGLGTIATLVGRPSSRWYALGVAAVLTLILNPRAIQEAGLQLSFAAVIGLFNLNHPIREALLRRRVPAVIAEPAAMATAATITTAPLLAIIFQQVSLASVPANVAAAPAIAPAMWLGIISAALGQLSTN